MSNVHSSPHLSALVMLCKGTVEDLQWMTTCHPRLSNGRGESFAALGILVVVTERPRRTLDINTQGLWTLLNVLNSALPRRFTGL